MIGWIKLLYYGIRMILTRSTNKRINWFLKFMETHRKILSRDEYLILILQSIIGMNLRIDYAKDPREKERLLTILKGLNTLELKEIDKIKGL
ncbi:MAG: hypothetical protein WBH62_08245 [Methanothermobacter tenebrarum]